MVKNNKKHKKEYENEDEEEQENEEEEYEEHNNIKLAFKNIPLKKKIIIISIVITAISVLWFIFRDDHAPKKPKGEKGAQTAKTTPTLSESDNVIKNIVNIVGAENYAETDVIQKSALPDKPMQPPTLAIPNVPAIMPKPELMQPKLPTNIIIPQTDNRNNNTSNTIPSPSTITSQSISEKPDSMMFGPIGAIAAKPPGSETRNSSMIAFGGSASNPTNSKSGGGTGGMAGAYGFDPQDPLSSAKGFVDSVSGNQKTVAANDALPPAATSASQSMATAYGRLQTMLAQGKVIDVILETAINNTLDGTVRAVVSRDVYSEGGNNILIPRGSRIIGSYASYGKDSSYTRLDIVWNRVMRNDGIDIITNNTKAIDDLGRNGASGDVDLKIVEAIRSALLVSSITVATAAIGQKMVGSDTSTSTTKDKDGNVSVLSTPVDSAITNASSQISSVLSDAIKKTYSSKPAISIPQGTRLKVFVNQDIIFSRGVANINKRK